MSGGIVEVSAILRRISKMTIYLFALPALLALAACGTLDVSFSETPEPPLITSTATRETAPDDVENSESPTETTNPWTVLERYTHPSFGYQISVPQGAVVFEDEEAENTTFFADPRAPGNGDYLISVQVLPEAGRSAGQLLEALATAENDASAIEAISAGDDGVQGAWTTYNGGPGTSCAELRMLLAAFVEQGFAYILRLGSNLPGKCDAGDLPEVQAIVQNFRPAVTAPILPMTPTPTPVAIDELVVAYTKDNTAALTRFC